MFIQSLTTNGGLQVYGSSYVSVASLRRAEFVSREDVHDDGENRDAGDPNGVDDHGLVRQPAVPLWAVDTFT